MYLFKSILLISSICSSQIFAQECKQRNKCECVFDDGSGYNLQPVVDDDNFLEAITEQNLTFFYHPCGDTKNLPVKNVSDVDNDCKSGYTLCMFNKTENKARVLGKHDDMSFKMNGEVMQVNFITSGTTDGTRASIWLQCVPKAKISVLYAPLEKIDQVTLSLFSRFACPVQIDSVHPHGFFINFFIIAFTLLFAYLFIGILFNYFFIGARGYELIPQYDLWCKVWLSLKLGFLYIKNGCRVIPIDDTYDAI